MTNRGQSGPRSNGYESYEARERVCRGFSELLVLVENS